ncbi:hypothetical protein [Arthrobacter sp.]|uniref:hypothetical protein n=1 Tax=Arthrobacter sp. TaxID=1667 RepID=UPI00289C1086|nr:hypothetical protein [Arthrobacter sp.]
MQRRRPPRRSPRRTKLLAGVAGIAVTCAAAIAVLPFLADDPPAASNTGPEASARSEAAPLPDSEKLSRPEYVQAAPSADAGLAAADPVSLAISDTPAGTSLEAGSVGLSLEATDLADPRLSADNTTLVAHLRGLGSPTLRFGGNAVDRRFFWTSSDEAVPPGWNAASGGPFTTVTPADLERVSALANTVNASIIMNVTLGQYDPERAADQAKHARDIFGKRLVGVIVGNEPNGLSEAAGAYNDLRPAGWSVQDYLTELAAYSKAIEAAAPGTPIAGPGTFTKDWWKEFSASEIPNKAAVAYHNYPLSSCTGADPEQAPTMANLVSPQTAARSVKYSEAAVRIGSDAKLETWLAETSASACTGSNEYTKTHASSLWSANFALTAARAGVSRIAFHSSLMACGGGPPMSVLCATGEWGSNNFAFEPRANYYGLSIVGMLGTGDFLTGSAEGGTNTYWYALRQPDESISVVLVNLNDPEAVAPTSVSLKIPAGSRYGSMSQLTGDSYTSTDSTLLDGGTQIPVADRDRIPGYTAETGRTGELTLPVTAGTVTVLNFEYR